MKLSKFNFELPDELISQEPYPNRDDCKLMILNRKTGEIDIKKQFKDLVDYFGKDDVIIFNDTKVFPARLYGNKEKTNAQIEVFLLRELNHDQKIWDVLVDPARKIRIGNKLYFGEDDSLVAEVIDNTTSRGRTLRFLFDGDYDEFKATLFKLGNTPLPREIFHREPGPEDAEAYQCIYAKNEGAVVAPAAGLHFSRILMKKLELNDVRFSFITLHAGLGNFKEIDVEDLTKYKIDSEQIIITDENADIINKGHLAGKHICAVGTTVMRAIESSVNTEGMVKPIDGWTNKFIFPPYDFSVADRLISNFHLPQSTMLMLVAAFGGYEKVMNAYDIAIKEKFKFGAYGDAMLII